MKFCCISGCEYPVFSKEFCKRHQYLRPDFNKKTISLRGVERKREMDKLKRLASEGICNISKEDFEFIDSLERFYDRAAKRIAFNPKCSECGAFIPKSYYRAATAHILPKSKYKSVASNDNNYVVLCVKNGCHQKAEIFSNLRDMNVFKDVLEKFALFRQDVTERGKLLNFFEEALKIDYSPNNKIIQ